MTQRKERLFEAFVIRLFAALLLAYGLPLCTLGMDKAPEKQKSQSPEGTELASAQGYDKKHK